jgi:hypothetical protein
MKYLKRVLCYPVFGELSLASRKVYNPEEQFKWALSGVIYRLQNDKCYYRSLVALSGIGRCFNKY